MRRHEYARSTGTVKIIQRITKLSKSQNVVATQEKKPEQFLLDFLNIQIFLTLAYLQAKMRQPSTI